MNEFNGFTIKLFMHENKYIAQICEVQNVLASADTLEEAISKLQETWDVYKKKCLEDGAPVPTPENTIDGQEENTSFKIYSEIKPHLDYLSKVYNLCFEIQMIFNNKPFKNILSYLRAQMMIIMRITDFLRCIFILIPKGYPEQACTLAASIFELSHTSIRFSYDHETANKWLESKSVSHKMPNLIGMNNWKELVKKNCNASESSQQADPEYKVYKQLCWMKHSLPKMQDLRVNQDENSVEFIFGPYSDNRSISHAWFGMEHAGRLTEFALSRVIDGCEKLGIFKNQTSLKSIKEKLKEITKDRQKLTEKAKKRFNTTNPFEDEKNTK